MAAAKRQMVEVESSMHTLFDHTADIKAQNRLILWYTLMLTHIQGEDDEEPLPYFKGETFDDKLEDYYVKEDSTTDFYEAVVKKVTTVLAFWFLTKLPLPMSLISLLMTWKKVIFEGRILHLSNR